MTAPQMPLDRIPGDPGTIRVRRRARARRRCDARTSLTCPGRIEPGDVYDAVTILPTHDTLGAKVPYRLSSCATCVDWTWGLDMDVQFRGELVP